MAASAPRAVALAALLLVVAVLAVRAASRSSHYYSAMKFVGGDEIDITKAPMLVQVETKGKDGKWSFKCTGFLAEKYDRVLTTANCVGNRRTKQALDKNLLRVRAGSKSTLMGGALQNVKSVLLMPGWTPCTPGKAGDHTVEANIKDAAVLTLTGAFTPGNTIKAATLAAVGKPPAAETMLIVAGFSITSLNNLPSLTLRRGVLRVIPQATCDATFKKLGGSVAVGQYCIRNGIGKAPCDSDMGAPAALADGKVVGIFSWAWYTCGYNTEPGVVTDLTNAEVRRFVDKALA